MSSNWEVLAGSCQAIVDSMEGCSHIHHSADANTCSPHFAHGMSGTFSGTQPWISRLSLEIDGGIQQYLQVPTHRKGEVLGESSPIFLLHDGVNGLQNLSYAGTASGWWATALNHQNPHCMKLGVSQ